MNIDQLPSSEDAASVEERIEQALYPEDTNVPEEDTGDANQDDPTLEEDGEELELEDDQDSDGDELETDEEDDGEELTLADYLGIDESQLTTNDDGEVIVNAKIDGKITQVPLKGLVESYQLQEHVNNTSTKLGLERKEFEAKRNEELTKLDTSLKEAIGLTSYLEQQVVGDYNSIDWNRLRAEDPVEWTALQAEFSQRAAGLETLKGKISGHLNELSEKQASESAAKNAAYEAEQAAIILRNNPTWADPKVRDKVIEEQSKFLIESYGFTPEIIATVKDARIVELIKDAKAFRDAKSKAANAKINKDTPKFQKPGSKRRAQTAKAREVKGKRIALRKSGNVRDAAALIEPRM